MKILYLTNVPSPYMVNYFNELGKFCELTVLFDKSTSTERDNSWKEYNFKNFNGIILKGFSTDVDAAFCPQVIKYLKRGVYDYIFITNMSTPTGMLAIEYLRWKKMDYFLESEGGFAKDGKGFKEKIKKHIMSGAKLYFSTTPIGDEYFLMYGATKDKLVKYPFTSIYEKDILKQVLSEDKKRILRKELSIQEEKVIITVGQFIPRKGFDILLKACEKLSKNIGIYLIGGIPTDEYILMKEQLKLDNVHFVGFKRTNELAKYYKCADFFVFPTREDVWGLVINEAMAYGLPIITTDKCIAGLELIKNGENGYIVPVEDENILYEQMNKLILDEALRKKMGENSLKKIHEYTFETMAKVHMDFLNDYSESGNNK